LADKEQNSGKSARTEQERVAIENTDRYLDEAAQVFVDLGYAKKKEDVSFQGGPELELTLVAGEEAFKKRIQHIAEHGVDPNEKDDSHMPEAARIKTLDALWKTTIGSSMGMDQEPNSRMMVSTAGPLVKDETTGATRYATSPKGFIGGELVFPPGSLKGVAPRINGVQQRVIDKAQDHGLEYTYFRAKPYEEQAANGVHLNVTAWIKHEELDKEGNTVNVKRNAFREEFFKGTSVVEDRVTYIGNRETGGLVEEIVPRLDGEIHAHPAPNDPENQNGRQQLSEFALCLGHMCNKYLNEVPFMFARADMDYERFGEMDSFTPNEVGFRDRKGSGDYGTAMWRGGGRIGARVETADADALSSAAGPLRMEIRAIGPGALGHPNKDAYEGQRSFSYELVETTSAMIRDAAVMLRERAEARTRGEDVEPLTEEGLMAERFEIVRNKEQSKERFTNANNTLAQRLFEGRIDDIVERSHDLDRLYIADQSPNTLTPGPHVKRVLEAEQSKGRVGEIPTNTIG
jgi:hypothetical protein